MWSPQFINIGGISPRFFADPAPEFQLNARQAINAFEYESTEAVRGSEEGEHRK